MMLLMCVQYSSYKKSIFCLLGKMMVLSSFCFATISNVAATPRQQPTTTPLHHNTPAKIYHPFNQPWKNQNAALVLDLYHGDAIDWDLLAKDKRIVAIIHKATEGLTYTDPKYAARKQEALKRGYLWGSYHLGRATNPIAQAKHYLQITQPAPNEFIALDLENLNSRFMSINEVEKFIHSIHSATGRYPVLYTNNHTVEQITAHMHHHPIFANVKLWYARYIHTIPHFPAGVWNHYTLWQFASEINCPSLTALPTHVITPQTTLGTLAAQTKDPCPYRIPGIEKPLDISVFWGNQKELKQQWPLNQ